MSFKESALLAARTAADQLYDESRKIACFRSYDATKAARFLMDLSTKIHEICHDEQNRTDANSKS